MLWIAIILFLAAAVGGLVMAVGIFNNRKPAMPLALIHGAAAAAGLLLLVMVWLNSQSDGQAGSLMLAGLGVLAVAALGGFFLFSFHLRDKPHPKAVVALHAVLAVAGVGLLLTSLL